MLASGESAESEVLEDSVGEEIELILVNNTWGLGVNLGTLSFNPCPVSGGWGVLF